MQRSVEEYERLYMDPVTDWSAHAWLEFTFGILSISSDLQHAEVYLGSHCGPACGTGSHYWLKRSPSGRWWVQQEKYLWDS